MIYPISDKPARVKDCIFQVLVESWPLSVRELKQQIKSRFHKSYTYQAIHKKLQDLEHDEVVIKQDKCYLLNKIWLRNTRDQLARIEENYALTPPIEKQEMTFHCLKEFLDFFLEALTTDYFHHAEEKNIFLHLRRFFIIPLGLRSINQLKKILRKKHIYILCREEEVMDHWAAAFLKMFNIHVRIGVECARPSNLLITGDCVVDLHVFLPDSKVNEIDSVRKEMRSFNPDILNPFEYLYFKEVLIKVLINRNRLVADKLKKESLQEF